MPRWRALIFCVILVAGLPTLAGAQGYKWWQSDRMKAELTLTPEQSTKLEEVFQDLYPRLSGAKDSLDRLEKRLSSLIAPGTASEADVMRLVYEVEDARAALNRTRTLMLYRMHLLLTPEQREKMKALHDKAEQERRKGGRQPGRRPGAEDLLDQGGVL